jgi:hypothetical protein
MKLPGVLTCCALAGPVLGAGCVQVASQTRAEDAAGLATAIASAARTDPGSPDVLAGRLAYADSLARASGGDCARRLEDAQAQLDAAAESPALEILLPLGPARLADTEYQLHLARASCGSDTQRRQSELREALAAAQRAVECYRDALDYPSMAIMQFNVAGTQRLLGSEQAALSALESAIEMDREYGLRQDEEDNRQVLARWQGATAEAQTSSGGPPEEKPPRSAALKFAWAPGDAELELQFHSVHLIQGKIERVTAMRTITRHIREMGGGWLVSHVPAPVREQTLEGLTDARLLNGLAIPLTQALLEQPDIEVSVQGELTQITDAEHLAGQLQGAAQDMVRDHAQSLPREPRNALANVFAPQLVAERAEESYNFQTGTWIGAVLEQGVWYTTTAPLTMAGLIQLQLPHDVEFAYTRELPCTAAPRARACIEIVVHGTPQADALNEWLKQVRRELHLSPGLKYWSATYLRIVTDPATLTPYVLETRRHWYVGDGATPRDGESVSERTVLRFNYPHD